VSAILLARRRDTVDEVVRPGLLSARIEVAYNAIIRLIGAVKTPEARARKIARFVALLERGETIHG
jgi:hypothetical protein